MWTGQVKNMLQTTEQHRPLNCNLMRGEDTGLGAKSPLRPPTQSSAWWGLRKPPTYPLRTPYSPFWTVWEGQDRHLLQLLPAKIPG